MENTDCVCMASLYYRGHSDRRAPKYFVYSGLYAVPIARERAARLSVSHGEAYIEFNDTRETYQNGEIAR